MRALISRYVAPALGFVAFLLIAFTTTAHAAGAVAPADGGPLDLARPVFDQIMAGHYLAAAALALVLATALVKRYVPGKAGAFVHSDVGGVLTTIAMAFFGAISTATMGGATWHWSMASTAGLIAFAAAGGYAMIKKLIVEPFRASAWYQNKAPAWLKAGLQLVFWMFDKPDAGAEATKAGEAAVAANPAQGAEAAAGKPEVF